MSGNRLFVALITVLSLNMRLVLLTSVLALSIATATTVAAISYSNFQIPGAQMTQVLGINNAGNLSGNYTDKNGITHGFVIVNGKLTNIDGASGNGATSYSLNNLNQVAGSYPANSFSNGFIYTPSTNTYTDIIVPTATAGTVAVSINDSGQVVGYFADNAGTHGFLFNGTTYQTFNMPGVIASFGVYINNKGLIAVQGLTATGDFVSSLYNGSSFMNLNVPGAGTVSAIHAVNNFNQCVFSWTDGSGNIHGSFYSKGKFTQLDYPGAFATRADGINDRGVVVGPYNPTNGAALQSYKAIP
jgi:probable HAF family extracellular repeat protein